MPCTGWAAAGGPALSARCVLCVKGLRGGGDYFGAPGGVDHLGGAEEHPRPQARRVHQAFAYNKIQRVLAPFHLPKRTWILSAASSVVLTTCDERNSTPGRSRAGSTAPTSLRLTLKLVGCSAPSSAPAGAAATNPSSLRQGGRGSLRVGGRVSV